MSKVTYLFLCGLCAILLFPLAVRADLCQEPVTTESGLVSGFDETENPTCVWRGIPFAAAPVGELRWRNPQPAPAWDGVREAATFGPRCMQKGTMAAVDLGSDLEMSEDCLYLNVWRPKKSGPFPVMVWIHGGGYTGGTGSTPMYWGDRLAAAGDVVVVTINYRLNIFGFLAHEALRAEDEHNSAGSYGSLDQVAAIKWVHDNIEGFGGDPGAVTIFGESAGGWSVCTMLATPLNQGMFHRAIIESGGCETSASLEKGYAQAAKSAEALGCAPDDIACLRAVSAEDLLDKGSAGQLAGFVWVPHHDDYLLSDQPLRLIQAGKYNQVPFMAGSNRNEVDALLLLMPQIKYATPKKYKPLLQDLFGLSDEDAGQVMGLYPLAAYENKPKRALGQISTDAGLACPTFTGMDTAAAQQDHVFYYRFDYRGQAMGRWLGAVHAMELPFIFNSMDRPPISALYHRGNMKEAQALSKIIQGYWINFAKTGDPNGAGLPAWPEYRPEAPKVQVLNNQVTTEDPAMKDRCEFWKEYNRNHPPLFESMGGFGQE